MPTEGAPIFFFGLPHVLGLARHVGALSELLLEDLLGFGTIGFL